MQRDFKFSLKKLWFAKIHARMLWTKKIMLLFVHRIK